MNIVRSANGRSDGSVLHFIFRSRLMVGQRALNPFIFVRVEAPEPNRG